MLISKNVLQVNARKNNGKRTGSQMPGILPYFFFFFFFTMYDYLENMEGTLKTGLALLQLRLIRRPINSIVSGQELHGP